jgi:hypothetical protein
MAHAIGDLVGQSDGSILGWPPRQYGYKRWPVVCTVDLGGEPKERRNRRLMVNVA